MLPCMLPPETGAASRELRGDTRAAIARAVVRSHARRVAGSRRARWGRADCDHDPPRPARARRRARRRQGRHATHYLCLCYRVANVEETPWIVAPRNNPAAVAPPLRRKWWRHKVDVFVDNCGGWRHPFPLQVWWEGWRPNRRLKDVAEGEKARMQARCRRRPQLRSRHHHPFDSISCCYRRARGPKCTKSLEQLKQIGLKSTSTISSRNPGKCWCRQQMAGRLRRYGCARSCPVEMGGAGERTCRKC